MTVRLATLADGPRVSELAGQWGYPIAAETFAEALELPTTTVAVCEVNGGVIGWIELRTTFAMGGGHRAEIAGLVVDQAARRMGAGRALVEFAQNWAKEQGFTVLAVRSRTTREEAHRFYPSVGFEEVKKQAVYQMEL